MTQETPIIDRERTAYHIANITIDRNGIFHVQYVFAQPGTGKIVPIMLSDPDLTKLLKPVGKDMQRIKSALLKMVADVETQQKELENELDRGI